MTGFMLPPVTSVLSGFSGGNVRRFAPLRHKKTTIGATLVATVAATTLLAGGVIDTASAQSGRRICGHVWTAPSKSDPSNMYVYLQYAKVKLNSPGCIQAKNELDNNELAEDDPVLFESISSDLGEWHRNDFRETCEDFSTNYLGKPAGSDICLTLKLWTANPFSAAAPTYWQTWSGPASDWHGAR